MEGGGGSWSGGGGRWRKVEGGAVRWSEVEGGRVWCLSHTASGWAARESHYWLTAKCCCVI